ncbi:hypothetical protein [Arthrobacter sp. Br18]|uniref:hypothetical protein n=1 Tax=Arthrobacter sp. Br18 TaxID=1312954 RepID=UPI0004BBE635|nr:hypothetical protein [Arthrobacter sp. Br18]
MEYLAVLLPSASLAVIFYFVMRSIFNADRSEREAMARAEERNPSVPEVKKGSEETLETKANPESELP